MSQNRSRSAHHPILSGRRGPSCQQDMVATNVSKVFLFPDLHYFSTHHRVERLNVVETVCVIETVLALSLAAGR